MPVGAPSRRADAGDELDAPIEEARGRPRGGRVAYLAVLAVAAALGGGLYLAVGGRGGGARGGGPSPGDQGPGAAAAHSANPAGYRCPTSLAALKASRPGRGVPGCSIRFFARVPAGWHSGPTHVLVFPAGAILSEPATLVRYANFPLTRAIPIWPIPMPVDGIAIAIFPQAPAPARRTEQPSAVALRPGDFRRVRVARSEPMASTSIYRGGWRFQVQVRVGAAEVNPGTLDEANAVLNSIKTRQNLCPCGAGNDAG